MAKENTIKIGDSKAIKSYINHQKKSKKYSGDIEGLIDESVENKKKLCDEAERYNKIYNKIIRQQKEAIKLDIKQLEIQEVQADMMKKAYGIGDKTLGIYNQLSKIKGLDNKFLKGMGLQDAASGAQKFMDKMFGLKVAMKSSGGGMKGFFKVIGMGFKSAGVAAKTFLVSSGLIILQGILLGVVAATQKVVQTFMKFNIGGAKGIFGKMNAQLKALSKIFEVEIAGSLKTLAPLFKSVFGGVAKIITTIFKIGMKIVTGFLKAFASGMGDANKQAKSMDGLMNGVLIVLKGVGVAVEWIAKGMGFLLAGIFKVGSFLFKLIVKPFKDIWTMTKAVIKLFKGDFAGAFDTMKGLLQNIFDVIPDWIIKLFGGDPNKKITIDVDSSAKGQNLAQASSSTVNNRSNTSYNSSFSVPNQETGVAMVKMYSDEMSARQMSNRG